MKLEEIGFYTLSDQRAANASEKSQLMRCELLITDRCNFNCAYCRGSKILGTLTLSYVKTIIDLWAADRLFAIRFSGGEPTLHPELPDMVAYAKKKKVKRIAISTNGSASQKLYRELASAGVNDFSVSLDACCASKAKLMAGGVDAFTKVVKNIQTLSKLSYVTTGVVLNEHNIADTVKVVNFAHELGVADIRIISSAQYNQGIDGLGKLKDKVLDAHPILKYRVANFCGGRKMRGIDDSDSPKCGLVVDDMAISGQHHYPCIIYLREGGNPIGPVGPGMRFARRRWMRDHSTHDDPICRANCLDVCVDYNNAFARMNACATVVA